MPRAHGPRDRCAPRSRRQHAETEGRQNRKAGDPAINRGSSTAVTGAGRASEKQDRQGRNSSRRR